MKSHAILLSLLMLSLAEAFSATNSFTPLDLSRHVTAPWDQFRPWTAWNGPPGGLQTIGGVPFQIDGAVQFRCVNVQMAKFDAYPTRTGRIPIRRRVARFHLLHFSEFWGDQGEPVARFVMRYADGKEHQVLLRYGVHLQDWNQHVRNSATCSDRNTRTVWTAPAPTEGPWMTTLWKTEVVNPRPEIEIASIEVRSLFSHVRYNMPAITVESGTATPAAEPTSNPGPMPEVREPVVISIKLLDEESGAPIVGGIVQAIVPKEGQVLQQSPIETGDDGVAAIDFPSGANAPPIELLATGQNHVSTRFSVPADTQGTVTFKMRRGKRIAGRVADEAGRPVVGAAVTVGAPLQDESGKFLMAKWPPAVTSSNGDWSLGCAPAILTNLVVSIQHSPLLPASIFEQDDTAPGPLFFSGQELAQGKAIFKIKRGQELKASAKCEGKAVTGALVTLFLWDSPGASSVSTRTDADGRFGFSGLPAGPVWLLISGEKFSPELQKVEPGTNSISISLPPAKTIETTIQDPSGRPLPNVLFQASSWRGGSWLRQFGHANAEGKFRWDSAPADIVAFTVSCPGYRTVNAFALSADKPGNLNMERSDQ
jgi:hypothetical protein